MPQYLFIFYNLFLWFVFYSTCKKRISYDINSVDFTSNSITKQYRFLFIILFFYSLFTFFGGDNDGYRDFVEQGYLDAAYYDFYKIDPLYVYLASISMGSFEIWKTMVYGTAIILVFLALKRLKYDNYHTLILFAVMCMISFGSTRAVLAYSIYLYGVSFLSSDSKCKWGIGATIIILSYFGHTSMVLPIILTPLFFFRLTKKRVVLLLIAFPFLIGIINILPYMLQDMFVESNTQAAYKMDRYLKVEETESSYGSILTNMYELSNFILYIPIIYWAVKEDTMQKLRSVPAFLTRVSFFVVYISFLLKFSNIPTGGIIYARYFTMFPFFLFAVIAPILSNSDKGNSHFKYLIIIGGIRGIYFFLMSMYYASFRM